MKKIPLTKGKFAIVDDEDFYYLSRFNWYSALEDKRSHESWIVRRAITTGYGKRALSRIEIRIENFILPEKMGFYIIHINKDPFDFRKENLGYTTYQTLKQSAKKAKGKTSKYKGVSFQERCPGKPWRWGIEKQINGKRVCWRGSARTEDEAAIAYNKKAIELFGEFAYQNKV